MAYYTSEKPPPAKAAMLNKKSCTFYNFPSSLASLTLICSSFLLAPCHAQTFDEVLQSEAMREIQRKGPKDPNKEKRSTAPQTNYDSLWVAPKPGRVLLEWIGAKIPNFTIEQVSTARRDEYAYVQAILKDKSRVSVEVIIQVPKPEYITMAEYGTLVSFNRFRPPLLDVLADQTVTIQDREAKYYRARDGACSLLLRTEKQGIINLRTEKCANAPIMMNVARSLNIARLDQKLIS